MISLDDIVGMCDLTEAEILAIAEHEHMPEGVAAAYGEYLADQAHGFERIGAMIIDDVREAQARGDRAHVLALLHVLHHFIRNHPEAAPDVHPWSAMR
ncbi:hypothetical protein [Roseitalea porphyridii]|uniref:Uncharacterized protein n=1 Tax=Roseitalea porphyridii TaxID=1852022 RepID=A0A4P6UYN7_9HYPH|nr:hypothetical protein [Roseitalea porphyridii]QBK30217.1 hypothetical protein E0E05_06150 [Roseitalea porphyridii]